MNWMQHSDDSRVELRELNDANYARVDGRISRLEERMDARFAAVDARFDALTERMDARFAAAEERMDRRFAEAEVKFERRFGDLLKWSFVFWCGAIAAIAALTKVLH